MFNKRIQVTLFIDAHISQTIEFIRKEFNRQQYDLIKAHVTLCREAELEQLEKVILNLSRLDHTCLTLDFGEVIRFSNGKGVLLPANGQNKSFQKLRKKVLNGIIDNPETVEPHITLMHPRNSTCTDEQFEQINSFEFPNKIIFSKISLIEQEAGMKWNVLREFELKG